MKNIYPGQSTGFLFSLILFIFLFAPAASQEIPIGTWRHHLPNRTVISLAEGNNNIIYAATPYGLLEYDKTYNSIRKIDKVDGLSDFGISVINYSKDKNLLLMGYQNGNVDILQGNQIFSVSDIRQANILGSKTIHNILFSGNIAYLSCGFGIVLLDLTDFVILDTWFIGPDASMLNVYDLAIKDSYFYAATEAGLLKASADAPNLADFQYWNQVTELPVPWGTYNNLAVHGDLLFANFSAGQTDSIYYFDGVTWNTFAPQTQESFFGNKTNLHSSNGYLTVSSDGGLFVFDSGLSLAGEFYFYAGEFVDALDALMDSDNILWAADNRSGLIKGGLTGGFESIIPEGPSHAESFGLAHNGGALWVAPGSTQSGIFNDRGIFVFYEQKWQTFNRWLFPEINSVRNIHQVTPHRGNTRRVFAASWMGGLLEFDVEDGLINFYHDENSTLQRRTGAAQHIRVGGSAWDSNGNLWVTNSNTDLFLHTLKPDGTWMGFPHNGNLGVNEIVGKVVVDNFDQKWVALPDGGGIMVFKEESLNGNQAFDIRKLGTQEGNGALPNNRVTALAKDKDGYIWVGTNGGVVVFYSPQQVFRSQSFNAQTIIVLQDGFAGRLFENEIINTIFVDGSNKKWFGTQSSGAFLLSSDARETILHFNKSNSPLPSNNILDISIDPKTGEVFFATDQGLVSYRAFATEGQSQHADVYAFPNPVRPGYAGYIAVKGLVTNARVKITDINGNLVYDTFAEGGQLVWNGRDLFGNRPSSGVYLVFSTDPEGNETMVTKILFLK
ncbi:MAG: hypothetical protein K0B37_08920 [Bacteroidales bacterium]|nr:hypothetical protein [Bacteroidales bacterium]